MILRFLPVLTLALATPVLADDPAKGEADFKKCKSCHSIIAPDGAEIQKGGKTGPNLWGIIGNPVAHDPDFKFGDGILAARAAGAVWDDDSLEAYVQDPAKWVQDASGDPAAKSKMSFKLAKGAEDMAAYLATLTDTPAVED
jgi:cytochrome c